MKRTQKKVYNMAYRLSGNAADAEDLTQEAFFRAYRSFDSYEGDKPFENWILRIVTRLYLDLLRHRRRRVQTVSYDNPLHKDSGEDDLFFEQADDTANPDAVLMDANLGEELEDALRSLPAEQRLVVMLADIDGVPYKDIAEMLDAPVGTIRSRLHRTHKALRQKLAKWEEQHEGHIANMRFSDT
ncbi:MAG: sigma-70 family RNA polymerase sigma factor [Armatimonadota bacterium]|nr:sigma-70 family RNA polymerase sigma factor [Armatimonadota bacterium]